MIGELAAFGLGGTAGALARGGLLRVAGPRDRLGWPPTGPACATLAANTLGCLLLGLWLAQGGPLLEVAGPSFAIRLEAAVVGGFCGGLSTFSSLCWDTVRLGRSHGPLAAGGYLAATIALGLAALGLGLGRTGSIT